MKPKAWIFDMDGVLVDTNPFHKRAWTAYARELGHDITEEWMASHVYGRINREALTALLGHIPSESEVKRHTMNKETMFIREYSHHIQLIPGLDNLLPAAKTLGIPMAVATSAPRMNVEFIFDRLGLSPYFPIVIDDELVTKGKPDPEIYLLTAEKLGIQPAECLVFEDSFSGVAAGLAAGMKVIAVSTTHAAEEFEGVELVIGDFEGLEPSDRWENS